MMLLNTSIQQGMLDCKHKPFYSVFLLYPVANCFLYKFQETSMV